MTRVVVLGSFHRHLDEIQASAQALHEVGWDVLFPKAQVLVPRDRAVDFILLETDWTDDPLVLERQVLAAIDDCDVVFIVSAGGYVGATVAFELGYATARGRRIVFSETPADGTLRLFGEILPAAALASVLSLEN
jgi:nucleoside 2-deoxyribosyltransferase